MPFAPGLEPSVLRLVAAVCEAAGDRVPVAVCGDLAASGSALPRLIGAGVRGLSVAPPLIPQVKDGVRGLPVPA